MAIRAAAGVAPIPAPTALPTTRAPAPIAARQRRSLRDTVACPLGCSSLTTLLCAVFTGVAPFLASVRLSLVVTGRVTHLLRDPLIVLFSAADIAVSPFLRICSFWSMAQWLATWFRQLLKIGLTDH